MRKKFAMWSALPLVFLAALASESTRAHWTPAPCDFITGGGWVWNDVGAKVNFGAHGGCKNDAFWGHVNVVDHSYNPPAHLKSTSITGYLFDPAFPNARDICGVAEVSVNGGTFTTRFRVRMEDNGEPGGADRFGLRLSNGYVLTTRELGPPGPTGGGGNIQLHKPNPSTTPPVPTPTEAEMCPGLNTP
ncbi:MAG TPA: post-COAP-1 domain-containing protein [Burkholderiales bacterium]|nr:post-COAP-1 domain-containing protein [Burkholderiales bacterium]